LNGSFNTINNITVEGGDKGTAIELVNGSDNIIKDNRINACTSGVYIFRSDGNKVTSNLLTNCSKAIYIEEGARNLISQNQIQDNEQGVFCSYSADNNIEKNNLIGNVEHAKFAKFLQKGFLIPNKWKMNYWDDFKGILIKTIFGLMYVPIGSPIGFFLPWYEFDTKPTNNPYPFS